MRQIPRSLSDLQRLVDGVPRPAPPEDVRVAEGYAAFGAKGALVDGRRRTVMTAQTHYTVGDEVRVVHIYEVQVEGVEMVAMGPKVVYGEYVDGALATPEAPEARLHDGPRILSPAVDFFFDVTVYQFDEGDHEIYWQPDTLRSNTLRLTVTSEAN